MGDRGSLLAYRLRAHAVWRYITPPTVAITSQSYATTNSLTLGGIASDDVAVTQVTWANSRGGSGVATGTTSWTASGIVLQPGVNVITVTASDAAGNTASVSVTVKRWN